MAAIRDQFVTARKAATRLGLDDAREGRQRRTSREVVAEILNGSVVAPVSRPSCMKLTGQYSIP